VTPEEREAAAARDQLEEALAVIFASTLANANGSEIDPEPTRSTLEALLRTATWSAVALLLASLQRHGRVSEKEVRLVKRDPEFRQEVEQRAVTRAAVVAERVTEWSRDHLAATDSPAPDSADERPDEKGWVTQASRSLATQTASEVVNEAAEVLTPTSKSVTEVIELGDGWKKLWISRGDSRVRELHRKLHGQPVKSGQAFWRWPLTGEEIRYPGDPTAPLSERINCRCVMFWVPVEVSDEEIVSAFAPSDFDESFDLVASAGERFRRERELNER
jgi:hypothetical protein